MFRSATVTLLLTTCLVPVAVAAQEAHNETEKARRLNTYLDNVGITNPTVREFITSFQERKEGRYLRVAQEKFDSGGRIVLHYKMQPKIGAKQFQLKYQSSDRRSEIIASTKAVMYSYKWEF